MPKPEKSTLKNPILTNVDDLAESIYRIGRGCSQFTWNTLEEELENAEGLLFSISDYADLCKSRLNKIKKRVSAIKCYIKQQGSLGRDSELSRPSDIEKIANEMRSSLSARVSELAILEDLSARFLSCLEDEEILGCLLDLKRGLQKRSWIETLKE